MKNVIAIVLTTVMWLGGYESAFAQPGMGNGPPEIDVNVTNTELDVNVTNTTIEIDTSTPLDVSIVGTESPLAIDNSSPLDVQITGATGLDIDKLRTHTMTANDFQTRLDIIRDVRIHGYQHSISCNAQAFVRRSTTLSLTRITPEGENFIVLSRLNAATNAHHVVAHDFVNPIVVRNIPGTLTELRLDTTNILGEPDSCIAHSHVLVEDLEE